MASFGYFSSGASPFRTPRTVVAPQNRGLPAGTGSFSTPYQVARVAPQPPLQQQAPAAAPAPTPAPAGPSGPGPLDLSALDYSHDPILMQMQALAHKTVAQAQADALRQEQQLAIGYGDPAFAQKLNLGDQYTKAAQGNPFSTVAELGRTYQRRNTGINSNLSDQHNLFYSSTRARQLALSGEQDLRDRATAARDVQDRVAQIQQAVVQAQLQAQAMEIQAQQEAMQRAINAAIYAAGG